MKRDALEGELLAKLQNEVLSDVAIDYCLSQLEREIARRSAALSRDMDGMRKRKAELESEILRLGNAIASGPGDVPPRRALIVEREAELSRITAMTLGREKGSVHHQTAGLRKFVRESLADIRRLLAGKHSNPAVVRQELARHIESITLSSDGKDDAIRYKGEWKLLGYTGGAEGGFRSNPPNVPEVTNPFEGRFPKAA